jgi:transcriptional regulator with XRE-family HTH domain
MMISETHEAALFELLGKRIRSRRQDRGHTQEELAKLISLSRTSLTNIEQGRQRPPLHQLLRVAEALECEIHDLLPRRSDLGLDQSADSPLDLEVVGKLTPDVAQLLSRIARSVEANDDKS